MMTLETPDGRLFTFKVDRYEFPDEELEPTEDNPADDFQTGRFLVVSHTFRNIHGEWTASGPTMTTDELQRFAGWLTTVRDRKPTRLGICFTERDLEISFDKDLDALQIHVFRDFLPPWASEINSITIDFPRAHVDLSSALVELNKMLAAFPGRPTLPNTN